MRQAPRKPNEAERQTEPAKDDNLIVQTREYELITPLFGGGVEPGQCDDLTPIRGTEIRGHLRFWWRATRGGNPLFEGKLEMMKLREDEIWGTASSNDQSLSSEVRVFVAQVMNSDNGENLDRPFEIVRGKVEPREGSAAPAYIAFPLQPTTEDVEELWRTNKPTKAVRLNVTFKLEISFRAHFRPDIEAALWAWETFGGVGARTRRGFGALGLKGIIENGQTVKPDLPPYDAVKTWIQRKLSEFELKGKWNGGVPHLPSINRFRITNAQRRQYKQRTQRGDDEPHAKSRELEVLEYLAEKLKLFRQSRYDKKVGIARDGDYGLSRWPEAEEIRRRLGISSRNEATRGIEKFPRAKLGLPIVFHLPHDGGADVELKGTTSNRRASPLIFRPLVCADGRVVGVAVVLEPSALPPDQLQLKGITNNNDPIDVEPGADLYRIQPLRHEKDIFKAFLDTLV